MVELDGVTLDDLLCRAAAVAAVTLPVEDAKYAVAALSDLRRDLADAEDRRWSPCEQS